MEIIVETKTIEINPGNCTIEQLQSLMQPCEIKLHDKAYQHMQNSAKTIENVLKEGKTVYGINTGFGLLAKERIGADQLRELQYKLVRSHTAGIGEWLPKSMSKLILGLKINSLAQGYSGIRPVVVDLMIALYNHDIIPCIHEQGSVGASGDLAPLADLASVLIGDGYVHMGLDIVPAAQGLSAIGKSPIELAPKEGLTLLNGTQASTGIALAALFRLKNLFDWALISGAISVDAAMASSTPFDHRIHEIRRQTGQIIVAQRLTQLLADSEICHSHHECGKVQDAYSFRCQPQVMGACLDQIEHTQLILEREANAVTDNPLVFADDQAILSGGNFHAEPVAFAADNLALAICEIGSMCERRLAQLIDPSFSGLPAFLVNNGGINSGFMIPQVTAAALVSENKQLAHPASVDSIPTSANQEDHVSMATHAGLRLHRMCNNLAHVIAIELLAGCQGLDFRAPLKSSPALQQVHQKIRDQVTHYDEDRRFSADIERIAKWIEAA